MNNLLLSSIYRQPAVVLSETFPWTLPLFRDLKRLEFSSRVTFLVGEMARENRPFLRDWLLGHKQPQSAATTLIRMKHCGLPMSSREPFAWFGGIIQSAQCLYERRTYLATR
jgi:hypothetical protein